MHDVLVIGDPRLRTPCEPVAAGYAELAADAARLIDALEELRARTGVAGQRVATLLTGGNVTAEQLRTWLAPGGGS